MPSRDQQLAERAEALDRLRPLLIPGVVITHTRCLGIVEEHTFVRLDNDRWICGHPTRDTALIRGSHHFVTDIAPGSVTHINREPVALWLDPDVGKKPERVAYRPSPEQIMADRTLQLIEKNRIRDREAMAAIRDLLDEAGPDLAIQHHELGDLGDDVPW